MREIRDTPRPTMSDEEILKDYPRLKREYTLLHEEYRRLQSEKEKQLKLYGVGVTLPCERTDAEEYLNDLDIYHHPRVEDRTNKNSYEVADIMADFTNKYLGN